WFRKAIENRSPASDVIAVMADPVFSPTDERIKNTLAQGPAKQDIVPPRQKFAPEFEGALRGIGDQAGLAPLERLPATRTEALAIAKLAPPDKSLLALDFAASRETVMNGSLNKYRYLHFATHAYVDDIYPQFSWLALSLVDLQGRGQRGY